MSPILVRPVREQLEHDRVIRLLQAKYKRKFEVAINPGHEQTAPVGAAPSPWYPDLVLHSTERGRRLAGIVEVETAESVNNLEAMSQWAAFARQRAEFHLYVPAASIDVTRRLCADIGIEVTEIWAYHAVGDQLRFVLIQRSAGAVKAAARAAKPAAKAPPAKPAKTAAAKPAANGAKRRPGQQARPASGRSPKWRGKKQCLEGRGQEDGAGRPPGWPSRRPAHAAPPRNPLSRRPGAARPCPFLRVIRDKRGYETTYLMHWFSEGGRQRSRILYAFRGPSAARVGRLPLEPATMRHLEASFPGVAFDWKAVMAERQVIESAPEVRRRRPRREEAPAAGGRAPECGAIPRASRRARASHSESVAAGNRR